MRKSPVFWVWLVALPLLALLQYKLWLGTGGFGERKELHELIHEQALVLESQQSRNDTLRSEVVALKDNSDLGLIESRARSELGYVRSDETFFRFDRP